MLKIAHLAPVVLALWVAPALAAPPGCLQQIDNMTVEFDLPAAESVAATETSSASCNLSCGRHAGSRRWATSSNASRC